MCLELPFDKVRRRVLSITVKVKYTWPQYSCYATNSCDSSLWTGLPVTPQTWHKHITGRHQPPDTRAWGMTDWINTLFSFRAAVGAEPRSQVLTLDSPTSSCTETLTEGGGDLSRRTPRVAKRLHLLPQVLDRSSGSRLMFKSWPGVCDLSVSWLDLRSRVNLDCQWCVNKGNTYAGPKFLS